jgi:hypothetical protein
LSTVLSPSLKTDTIQTVRKDNWQRRLFDGRADISVVLDDDLQMVEFKKLNDTSEFLIVFNGMTTDTLQTQGFGDLFNPRFNYEFSLRDSILAVGMIVDHQPLVHIYKVGNKNERSKLHTILDGHELDMSFDCTQIFIKQHFRDSAFDDSIRAVIRIYDIPTDQWTILGSYDDSYSRPERISRDDYIYYTKSRNHHTNLWRTFEGGPEELVYDPSPPEYVWKYGLRHSGRIRVEILELGDDPLDPHNIRIESIDSSDLKPIK